MVCLTTLTGPARPDLRRHHSGDKIFLSSCPVSWKITLHWNDIKSCGFAGEVNEVFDQNTLGIPLQ